MKKEISRREFIRTSSKAGLFIGLAGTNFLKGSSNETFDLIIKNGTVLQDS